MKKVKGGITAVPGFLASGIHSGIKKTPSPDLAIIFSENLCTAAGVFTTNRVVAAPIRLTREHLRSGRLQAIVVNSGNANACTGSRGEADAREMAERTAQHLGISTERIAVASTGVMGLPLPMKAIGFGIQRCIKALRKNQSLAAARAIMTTDRRTKECAIRTKIGGRMVTLGGIAKGSGMIQPKMATMLAFLTTDLAIQPTLLHKMLYSAVIRSFNRITVDGETSTNDMVLCLANGRAGNRKLEQSKIARQQFQSALDAVCTDLAKMIIQDGEGATKLIEIRVKGGANSHQAEAVAMRVANSNLVKTAIYGEDANWGRIMAAIGASGAKVNPDRIDIFLDRVALVRKGIGLGPGAEQKANRVLKKRSLNLTLNLNMGMGSATVWTCDLTEEYIQINASYRT